MSDTFYLTTPIYYVNARPHIGHAYTTIVADVIARRQRLLLGDSNVRFLTGTDEHGQKIERSAAAAGIPPQQFTDQVSAQFRALWDRMGITYDDYIRTTEPRHTAGAQQLFRELYNRGFIYLSQYTGAYCVSDEAFVDLPVGTPCPDCGKPLEEVTEENFFFKLSAFQEKLINLIESGGLKITPDSARNEVLSFLCGSFQDIEKRYYEAFPIAAEDEDEDEEENPHIAHEDKHSTYIRHWAETNEHFARSQQGTLIVPGVLKDLSVSRSSFTWGIPVPDDIQRAAGATQKHVIYVWLDALANYMTAVGYGSSDPAQQALFQKFWPADLHLVGKEITRFHCVYWPAFLLAAGIAPPKQITANGWLLFDNAKMSKSRGNVVRTETILDAFGTLCPPTALKGTGFSLSGTTTHEEGASAPEGTPTQSDRDLFAADVLRYYLLREIPYGQDGSFSFDSLITRYNADLANGYGNLVSRTLNLITQNFDSIIPEATLPNLRMTQAMITEIRHNVDSAIISSRFDLALQEVMAFLASTDQYISESAPWKLAKDPNRIEDLRQVLYTAAESIRIITALLHPILPYATAKVWQQLGLGDIEQAARNGELTTLTWGGLQPGTKLGALGPIFPRADKSLIDTMIAMEENNNAPAPTPEPLPSAPGPSTLNPEPSFITIDDFAKLELRIAQITLAERIPKADKLLRLEVSLGDLGTRQILSGIAEWYTPEDLIGRRILIVANLAPRKMRGLESHGMLLAASEEGGKPFLATVPEGVPVGTRLK